MTIRMAVGGAVAGSGECQHEGKQFRLSDGQSTSIIKITVAGRERNPISRRQLKQIGPASNYEIGVDPSKNRKKEHSESTRLRQRLNVHIASGSRPRKVRR